VAAPQGLLTVADAVVQLDAELLGRFWLEPTPGLQLGRTPKGRRSIGYVKDGYFEGPKLTGTVLGGSDHLLVLADNAAVPDVRMAIRTHDGALIQMEYRGIMRAPRHVLQLFSEPEKVNPKDYYFRVAVFFETGDERYAWINQAVCVGYGFPDRLRSGVASLRYDVYKLL
jgi:hypothetical protein